MKISIAWIMLGVILYVIEDVAAQNCPPFSRIKNGRVKYRSRRRIAKFRCRKRYELFGAKSAVCIQDKWSHQTPKCVAARCSDVDDIDNMEIRKSYKGAVLEFNCQPGYLLQGAKLIYCDGRQWSDDTPLCHYKPPEMECTFEVDLCGWSDDVNDDFDWSVHQGGTPTARTGPTYDHTLKTEEGQYLYVETSSPRRPGDIARLFSPLYDSMDTGFCFDFYYHMMGPEGKNQVGDLIVFIKDKDEDLQNLQPVFNRSHHQGIEWLRGRIELGQRQSKFQIVITAIRRLSYSSDIAIDDVRIYNCSEDGNEFDQTTMVEVATVFSTEAEPSTARTESASAESSTLVASDSSTSIIPRENNLTMQTELFTSTISVETLRPESEMPSGITTEIVSEAPSTQPTKGMSTSGTSQSPVESSTQIELISTVESITSVKPEATTNILSTTVLTTSNAVSTEQTKMQTTELSEPSTKTTESRSTTDLISTTTQGITTESTSTEQTTFSTKPQQTTTSTTTLKTSTSLMTTTETRPSTTASISTTTTASNTTPTRLSTTLLTSPSTTTSTTTIPRSPTTSTTLPATISKSPATPTTSTTLSTSKSTILQTTFSRSQPSSSSLPTTVSAKPTTRKTTPSDSKSTTSRTKPATSEPIALSTEIDINTESLVTNKFNSASQKSMPIVTTSNVISVETSGLNKTENITDIPNVVSVGKSTRPSGPVKPLMIGVGVGVAVGLAIVLVAIFVYLKKKRIKTEEYEDEMAPIAKNAYSEW